MTEQRRTEPVTAATVLGGDDWSNFDAATEARNWEQSVELAKRMIRTRPDDLDLKVNIAEKMHKRWGEDGIKQVETIRDEVEAEEEEAEATSVAEQETGDFFKNPEPQPEVAEPTPEQPSSNKAASFDEVVAALGIEDTPKYFKLLKVQEAIAQRRVCRVPPLEAEPEPEPEPEPKPEQTATATTPEPQTVPAQTAAEVIEFATKANAKPKPQPQAQTQSKSLVVADARAPVAFQHSKSPTGIAQSLENALIAIDKLDIDCKYDIFHDRIVVSEHQIGLRGDALHNLDNVALKVRQVVLTRFQFDPGHNFTFDALKIICLDRVFDPVRDYLDSLRWDGVPRLNAWLIKYCGADDTPLNRAIGRKMLVAGVRRVRSPGCKFDYIVVLESEEQGIGKSTMLRTLAGDENFSDAEIIGQDKRDQQESIQGIWIYEIAELEGLAKSEVTHIKLFASKQVDSARPAYGRSRVDRPRRCIKVATTNERTYLRDTTGNRRYWPVLLNGVIEKPEAGIRMIDLAGIKRDRDQLWAEAAAVEAGGEPLVIPEKLWPAAKVQQQARMETDAWIDVLAMRLAVRMQEGGSDGKFAIARDANGNREWRVATDYLLTNVLSIPTAHQHNNHTKRLAAAMAALGWTRKETTIRIGKFAKRGYVKPIPPKSAGSAAEPADAVVAEEA
jgi:predicted P-loop ATPase